jgi:hypothetical protein
MSDVPLEVWMTWPKPNYINPKTRGSGMLVVSCIFLPLSVLSVCLRIYRKAFQLKQVGWDDALIVLAAVSLLNSHSPADFPFHIY